MRKSLRDRVWSRARGRCEYCQVPQECDPISFEIDHVIAEKHHGLTELENLALACFACNNHKGANLSGRDQLTRRVVRLFDPRRDEWSVHFRWKGAVLVGKTPRGRATVDVLAINLPHRVVHRLELIEEGEFPPKASLRRRR